MIVPMKKVFLLIRQSESEPALEKLRALGVIHVENVQAPEGIKLSAIAEDLSLIEQAQMALTDARHNPAAKVALIKSDNYKIICHHLVDLQKRISQLKEYAVTLNSWIGQWEHWGDFDPQSIRQLAGKNILIRFYQLTKEQFASLPDNILVKEISREGRIINCLIIAFEAIEISFKELEPPKMPLSAMKQRLIEDTQIMQALKDEIGAYAGFAEKLLKAKNSLKKDLEFYEALKGMGESEGIAYLKGYLPVDLQEAMFGLARQHGWGAISNDPDEFDRVPTLVRNPRWISIISPVFKMIEVVPGYNELDISLWFFIFFSIFFGILIGDAGYGLIYLLLTFLAQRKWGGKFNNPSIFILFYILSSFAVIWGFLTASFFGQEWLPVWARPIMPSLRNDVKMQEFCFFLGALHLSIAHLWRAILKFPKIFFLADIGWVNVLWGAFFMAKSLILGSSFPALAKWPLILGPALIIFFSNPRKNIFKSIGAGLGALLLNIMNNFTDIVSYIRLFAVGLATVAVADAFNKMAMGVGFNSFSSGLLTSFILLIGHLLNIILGPLSILVHGVRLNVLEFCAHLDIKWSGFAYRPLKEEKIV